MDPVQFFTLSSAESILGTAGIVLLATNFAAMIYEHVGWPYPAQFRSLGGIVVAGIVALLAMQVSPLKSGGTGLALWLWLANTCLLYGTGYVGSRSAAVGSPQADVEMFRQERLTLSVSKPKKEKNKYLARFWRSW